MCVLLTDENLIALKFKNFWNGLLAGLFYVYPSVASFTNMD